MADEMKKAEHARADDIASGNDLEKNGQFVDLDEPPLKVARSATKITDLNDYCLEKIFMHLDVKCLFNVANANKWLQISAVSVYGRKFGKNPVNVCSIRDCSPNLYMFGEYICLDSLKSSLAFLRCFGEKIPELVLFCRRAFASANGEYIERYMNQYCSDTLARICYSDGTTFSNDIFAKPFIKVDKVECFGSTFEYQMQNFIRWFPNVRDLEIHSSSINHSMMNVHVSNLEHLIIPIGDSSWNDIHIFLRSNPQINSLKIKMNRILTKTMNNLLDLISDNPIISKLNVNVDDSSYVDVNAIEVQRLISEHQSIAELILCEYLFSIEDIIILIGQLNSLKKFDFRLNQQSEYNRLVSQLDANQQWHHHLGHIFNVATKEHYYSVHLSR